MEITSLTFAAFALLVLVVYYLLPHKYQNFWLLLASLCFYVVWDWRFGLVLLSLTLINFWWARRLAVVEGKGWLWVGVGLNIAVLLVFKYNNFYLDGLSRLLGGVDLGGLQLIIPVGLSFYLVQVISTFVDVHLKRWKPETDLVTFVLYLFYFPKLLSGPIERARTFIPRLAAHRQVDSAQWVESFSLVMLGLVRKLVVADSLMALIPVEAFQMPGDYSAQHLVTWLLGYAIALYNDFAGYTNIVRGVSGFFGIPLSRNFMRPYFSHDFTEFWKRWHISLSEWLRDYIFFPTTRRLMKLISNRQHVVNLVVPPMVTMLVSGLWHGLSWHMLVWGGLHGVYQVVERVLSLRRPAKPANQQPRWRQVSAVLLVFVLAVLAWLPFRMELPVAWAYLKGMLFPPNWANPQLRLAASDLIHGKGFWSWPQYGLPDPRVFLVVLPGLWLDWRQEKKGELFFANWRPWAQAALLALALLALLLVSGADQQVPFVYQGF